MFRYLVSRESVKCVFVCVRFNLIADIQPFVREDEADLIYKGRAGDSVRPTAVRAHAI